VGTSFWARFRGLMGRAALPEGEGLYLATTSIHMLFMRFAIDALFVGTPDLDGDRRVVAVRGSVPAWRGLVWTVPGAEGVVELPSGTIQRTSVGLGDIVRFEALPSGGQPG
jgi:uncharacterized membrane protein (UPF0127 family)